MKGNSWDKLLLIAVSVAVIGLAGWFATKALAFKDQFPVPKGTPGKEEPETDAALANLAANYVTSTNKWTLPNRGTPPKPLPLFVSIPIIEVDGRLIDILDPNEPPIRPPATNGWLYNNNLDYLNKNVLKQDPDRDGYTNLEEWHGKTNPRDENSHPPYADKIVLVARRSQVYRAVFRARPDDTRYQIQRLHSTRWPGKETFYLTAGKTSDDDALRLDSFEEKRVVQRGIPKDASVLNVTFLPTGTKHKLVKDIVEEIHIYFGELEFLLDPGKPIFVKEGDAFSLPRDPDTKYHLTKVTDSSATIVYETGPGEKQTVEIKKK